MYQVICPDGKVRKTFDSSFAAHEWIFFGWDHPCAGKGHKTVQINPHQWVHSTARFALVCKDCGIVWNPDELTPKTSCTKGTN